jgi:hypothetical protein
VSNADIQWYLVIGIPLVAGFQLFVRRRPLRDLWVRDGQPVVNRVALQALVVAIAIYPLFSLIKTFTDPPSGEAGGVLLRGGDLRRGRRGLGVHALRSPDLEVRRWSAGTSSSAWCSSRARWASSSRSGGGSPATSR